MERLDLLLGELGALLEGRQPRLPEDLVDPGAADARDRRAGGAAGDGGGGAGRSARRNRASGGAGQASGPSVATISSSATWSRGSSFAQADCLVPNSRSRSSRPSAMRTRIRERRSLSDARLSNSCSRPADIRWISRVSGPRRSRGEVDREHLADPAARPRSGRPRARRALGSKVFSVATPAASADSTSAPSSRAAQAARGDLDFGQLGHEARVGPRCLDSSFASLDPQDGCS